MGIRKTLSMKNKNLYVAACRTMAAIAFVASSVGIARAQFVWDFGTGSGTASPSGSVTGLTAGDVTVANNISVLEDMLTTNSPSSGYAGASGNFNAGIAAKTGVLDPILSSYFQFILTPASGAAVNLSGISFGSFSFNDGLTISGPTSYAIRTDIDNFAVSLGSGSLSANNAWSLQSPSITAATGALNTPVTVRIYGAGALGTALSNTWRVDDLSVTAAAIPEPGSLVLLSLCALPGVALLRRRALL